jgi:outer membrane immunogenic protein
MGMESDLQASGQKGLSRYILPGGFALDASHKLSWFGTARSRLGILVTPSVLLYGTAGAAYGQVKADYLFTPGAAVVSLKDTKAGWTAGAGIEAALAGNWSAKLEYLYIDLGKNEVTAALAGANIVNRCRSRQTENEPRAQRPGLFLLQIRYRPTDRRSMTNGALPFRQAGTQETPTDDRTPAP